MPEGDTVWRTADRLHRALSGAPITLSDFRFPEIATADLRGAVTTEVVSHGKHLLHRIEGGLTLHSHLRMEGPWRVHPAPGPRRVPSTTRRPSSVERSARMTASSRRFAVSAGPAPAKRSGRSR